MPARISFDTSRNSPAEFQRVLGARSKFAQDAIKRGAVQARKRVEKIGEEAVREVESRVDELYERRSDHRHKKDAVPLHGSFYYEITSGGTTSRGNPTFPFTVVLKSDADAAHVMSLNRGSRPHKIEARDGGFLVIPRYGLGESIPYQWGKRPKRLQKAWLTGAPWRDGKPTQHNKTASAIAMATPGKRFPIREVNHPGIRASYFIEYA